MSEVKRYWVESRMLVQEGWHHDDTEVVQAWALDRVTAERDAALGREAALREELDEAQRVLSFSGNEADAYSTAALHEDLASVNSDKEAYAQNAIDLRKRVDALQALLTAADEELDRAGGYYLNKNSECLQLRKRADALEGLLRDWLKDFGRTHCGLQRLKERTQAAPLITKITCK